MYFQLGPKRTEKVKNEKRPLGFQLSWLRRNLRSIVFWKHGRILLKRKDILEGEDEIRKWHKE